MNEKEIKQTIEYQVQMNGRYIKSFTNVVEASIFCGDLLSNNKGAKIKIITVKF